MRRLSLLLIILLSTYALYAQYYVTGQDPANISWKQINTDNFQVIYPSTFEVKAKQLTSMLEEVYKYAGKTLNHSPRKISVILHNQTVHSNGFVAWAPARMELFTTPHQNIYPQDWLEQLAIHEFRHVVQIDKVWSELPFIFKAILGQQAAPLALGAYVPFWFLEGDATVAETAFSHTGRGRMPSFERGIRAQILEKGIYTYDKAYLGSFKDYIPNRYVLGYYMVASARELYGASIWSNVLNRVARRPLSFTPFDKSLKISTGKNKIGLYKETMKRLKNEWELQDNSIHKTEFTAISAEPEIFSHYRYPYYINDSTVFAVKSTLDDISRFVSIGKDGKESRLFTPGDWFQESVSFSGENIIWIERRPDVRWGHREFSLLRMYNIPNGKITENRFTEKIYAPSLSPDGKYLVAVKVDNNNKYSIALISPETFDIVKEISTPENYFFITPCWSEKSDKIYSVVQGSNGKTLMEIDPESSESKILLPFSFNDIKRPASKGNNIYFSDSQSGIDNIYALDLQSGRIFEVTSSRFGVSDVQISHDGNKIVYCDYSSDGFKVVESEINRDKWKEISWSERAEFHLADAISTQEQKIITFDTLDYSKYKPENYSKALNLFNFHSWAPAGININDEEIDPGFSLFSQNKLSTAITQLGYRFSNTTKTGKWFANLEYSGFFPVLEFNAEYGKNKSRYYNITNYQNELGEIVRSDTNLVSYTWKELNAGLKIKTPLNLTHGKWYRLLQPEAKIDYIRYWHDSSTPENFFEGNLIPVSYRLYFHNLLKMSQRDIQPRWGLITDFHYSHAPMGDLDLGNIKSVEGTLLIPGIAKHHGIKIYGGIQSREISTASFNDIILYPRGYQRVDNNKLSSIRSDYTLPLFYPDWNIGRWVYFRRFNLKLFYDYGMANIPVTEGNEISYVNETFKSQGAEITTDCNFLRFLAPAVLGGRVIYLESIKDFTFEFILAINFNAL